MAARIGIALAVAAAMTVSFAARAQRHKDDDDKPQKPLPEFSISPTSRAPWPRLDPGAIVCRTPDGLQAHAANVAARLRGEGAGSEPTDCHMLQRQYGVTILERQGPGRTRIRVNGASPEEGWTDTFLPTRQPSQ